MDPLQHASLREIVTAVRERSSGASAVVEACAARIAAREPDVLAWAHLDLERARRRAAALDAAPDAGGALHGVPIAVKDIIDVEGMPTRCGSLIYASAPAAAKSAQCVAALEASGAVVLGKTVTTEFAYYTPGKTRNPWNPAHTPGGSSMGSAAGVACGMVAAALGTQTNGSIIRPAAFCGVVGYKPSHGAVSNDGTLDPWPTLDHTGVFARRVTDAALLASLIVRAGTLGADVLMPARPLRLAVVRSPVWHLASPEQQAMLEANAATLRHAGAHVEALELPQPFEAAHRIHQTILAYEGARHFRDLQRREGARMSARLNALLDEGAAIADEDYTSALAAARALREVYAQALASFDAVITPPAPGEAPATLEQTGSPAFCTMWSLLGVPAVTIPVALGPAGLPLGLQIVGAYLRDGDLLSAAAWCEAHLPFDAAAAVR